MENRANGTGRAVRTGLSLTHVERNELVACVPTLRDLMDFSLAAYRNAVSLRRESEWLYTKRCYARSAALAVVGAEEAGKALILALGGLGQVRPERVNNLLRALRYGPKSHTTKHVLSAVAGFVGTLTRRIRPRLTKRVKKALSVETPPQSFAEFMSRVVTVLTPEVLQSLNKEMGYWSEFSSEMQEISAGSWQRIRDAGLYVDYVHGQLREPKTISRDIAKKHLAGLGTVLHGLRLLMPATKLSEEELRKIAAGPLSSDEIEAAWRRMFGDPEEQPTETE